MDCTIDSGFHGEMEMHMDVESTGLVRHLGTSNPREDRLNSRIATRCVSPIKTHSQSGVRSFGEIVSQSGEFVSLPYMDTIRIFRRRPKWHCCIVYKV